LTALILYQKAKDLSIPFLKFLEKFSERVRKQRYGTEKPRTDNSVPTSLRKQLRHFRRSFSAA